LDNLKEMGKFLGIYDHPKLNQNDINYLNRCITSNKIETTVIIVPKKKSPGLTDFSAEFYQIFKEELKLTTLKLFHKTEREGALPNSFYEGSITLIPKPDKDKTKKRITGQSL
jgi:hypothetical protein